MAVRLTPRNKWLVRYGAALAVAGAGMLVRLALEAWVGPGLPAYVTFYPAVMIAALLGGLGPGLVTTAACALITDYWILAPQGTFRVEHLSEAVGLAIFSGMGVVMSVVAELYRQARFPRLAWAPAGGAQNPRGRALFIDAALAVSLLIVGIAGWRCLQELESIADADRWTTHSYTVLQHSEWLLSGLRDAETGARGYFLTGSDEYLAPYQATLGSIATNLAALQLLTRDNPIQHQRLVGLETPVRDKLAVLKEAIELRRTQGLDAVLRLVPGKGKQLMDDIRRRVAEIQAEEERLLQARLEVKAVRTQNTLRAFLAGNVFGLLVLAAVFLFLRQENIGRRRAEAELRAHRDDLEQTVTARTADLGRANESLRQQREWLHVTLTSIGDAVLAADTAGCITFVNPVAEALTGWKEKDALGRPIQDVFRVINEETRAAGDDIVARVLREGGVVTLANHTVLVARDRREVPIEDSAAPIKDATGKVSGVVLVFHDVTEKRRAQAAVRESQRQNEFLATIIERAFQPFAVGYPDGRLGLLNAAFEELTGYTAEELHSMHWANTLTPPEWREVERQELEELARTGQPVRYEKEYLRKDGRRVPVELLVHLARDAKGQPEYYYSFLTDITGRKQAEEALRTLNEGLERRVAEQTAQIRQANEGLEQRVRERTAELEAARDAVQASRGATLSLLEDALEARAATEEANAKLQAAVESLETSRKAAVNLMEDALQARKQTEAASAELRENQDRLLRLNRVLKALKDSSLAMIRSTSEAQYLSDVCKILVEDCGHAMVWVGFAEEDEEKSVRPAAYSGFEEGYLETLRITWEDADRGRGPTGTAIRTGQPSACRDTLTDPALAPWRAEAVQRGYASSIAVPLLAGSRRAFGAITIYAKEPDAFSEDEVKLLTQLADDVSFCIRTLRLRVAKAQADLERDKFVSLAENSTVFIAMCGRDFVPFYVNEAGLRLVGLESLARACRTPFSEFFFPEDRKRMLQEFLPAALQTGRAEVEIRFRHFKTGNAVWMLYNVFHIRDAEGKPIGLGIVSRNITDRKQAERRTELLAETASQLLASDSPQLVIEDLCHQVLAFLDCQVFLNFLVDERAKRLHLNAFAGIPAEETQRLETRDLEAAICGSAALASHRIVLEDMQRSHDPRTGMLKSLGMQAYAIYPLIAQGRVLGTLSFGTRTRAHFTREEISLMKAVADQVAIALERQRAQAALRQTAEELKRSNFDLEQFAYVASHDLQEPLRAVGGYVRLLERSLTQPLQPRARRFLDGAIEGALRMERLIRDLLEFSRVGSRARELAPTELDAVLRQAVQNLGPTIAAAQASVTHDPLPKVAVDPTQMLQVFQNLIGNAIKFRDELPPAIHIAACQKNGSWVISVRDNGIGIDPDYFAKIFHLFQRLHTRKEYPGTGIGLAVCKRIIERHGGAIWVESQPGKGATFFFSLPTATAG